MCHHPRLSVFNLESKTHLPGGLHFIGVRLCGVTRVLLSFLDVDAVLFSGDPLLLAVDRGVTRALLTVV